MKDQTIRRSLRGAIYTRVSTEQGLEQDFNSLDAQREACEAYIKSQAHEGWRLARDRYDDGGYSGGSMDRPALQKLLIDVQARRIDVIVVYKVDRLTRSLADFAKLVETFDANGVSFVSVTQSFNTTTSMGRLTLNVLLSFAQFEREVTGERIRDKIAASKKKGMWMGGVVPLGYRVEERTLRIVDDHAAIARSLFRRYLEAGSVVRLKQNGSARILTLPWTRPSPYRKREIIQGANDAKAYARPMPANARAILIEALRDAHRWPDELLSDPLLTQESIASREGKTERSIRMTLSLAFLAPEIVKAAVEGRLPRGFGLKRLVDLPMAWPDQWLALGLQAPAQA